MAQTEAGRRMSGLLALLDDVAAIAKVAAASVDDIAAAAAKAGAKAAGVVIDDAAVTPKYVHGFSADRELPIIWRIALGSLRNKLVILLPAALLLDHFPAAGDHAASDAGRGLSVLRRAPRRCSTPLAPHADDQVEADFDTKRPGASGRGKGRRRDQDRFHPVGRDHDHRAGHHSESPASGCRR